MAQRTDVRLESLPGTSVPLVRLVGVLPAALAGVVAARRAARLERRWPLKGSTWQSIARAKPTEVDYLNGEIVRLGRETGVPTPLNAIVLNLVRRVEAEGHFLTARDIERRFTEERLPAGVRHALGFAD